MSNTLVDPMTSGKSYWSILKMFLNNGKIPCIPPLRHHNKYIPDFKEKVGIFNFAEQCFSINNSSKLPSTILKRTEKIVLSVSFSSNVNAKIVRELDPNKADGHDMISVRMLKIYDGSISKTLEIIFNSSISFQRMEKSKCGFSP